MHIHYGIAFIPVIVAGAPVLWGLLAGGAAGAVAGSATSKEKTTVIHEPVRTDPRDEEIASLRRRLADLEARRT